MGVQSADRQVYQHAQGGKRLQEAGCRPEQGEAEAEESQSDATMETHAHNPEQCEGSHICRSFKLQAV